ncbi:hypothetical protein SFC66_04400 [Terribacillus saccharophilus]|uniref:hypothetical protein n=1 Tax=Terribacillus saccharophilus TaxID=361277 RepID=UPI003982A4D8
MKCVNCKSEKFIEATDGFNLRPLDTNFHFGTPKIYTLCQECGVVQNIRAENPKKLLKKKS